MLQNESVLFPVRRAHWYVPRRPHSCATPGCVDSQGDAYYVAPNPDFGATFTYYLAEEIKSLKDQRRAREEPLEDANDDVRFASWERIEEEQLEDAPAVVFTVSDNAGNVIRHIEGPVSAGFHRVSWDLRYPALHPFVPEDERRESDSRAGVLVAPGRYRVAMQKRVDGNLTGLGETQTFEAVSIRTPTLEGSSQEERIVFQRQVDEIGRAVAGSLGSIDAVLAELDAVKNVVGRSTADMALYAQANSLAQRLQRERDRLAGNSTRGSFAAPEPMSVNARLRHAAYNPHANAYGPTDTQQQSLIIARSLYGNVSDVLRDLVDVEYASLKDAADAAGVPWTPGRGVQ
jgi:predicted  nucleic acid-binding Zn-ribbon protein